MHNYKIERLKNAWMHESMAAWRKNGWMTEIRFKSKFKFRFKKGKKLQMTMAAEEMRLITDKCYKWIESSDRKRRNTDRKQYNEKKFSRNGDLK